MTNIRQFNKAKTMTTVRKQTQTIQNLKGKLPHKPRIIKGGTGRPTGKGMKVR